MHDPSTILRPDVGDGWIVSEQCVYQCPVGVPRCRMYYHTGRFIHDKQVRILEDHVEREGLRAEDQWRFLRR
jgi:hypothetical protein